MNEWLKRVLAQIKSLWQRINVTQKILIFSILGVAIVAVILLFAFSAAPSRPLLFQTAITDDVQLNRITQRLDEENFDYKLENGLIYVKDEKTAMRARDLLVREDLLPARIDPWAVFDMDRWTLTDFERNVNLRRAIEEKLRQHILALEDVDAVSLELSVPDKTLFIADEKPITASVVITPKPGSDIDRNAKKIMGIEKLISFSISGLKKENITIIDQITGEQINDLDSDLYKAATQIDIVKKQLKLKAEYETKLKNNIYNGLAGPFTKDRVDIINCDVDLDIFEKSTQTEEHPPIILVPDNPKTPYDESKVVESITQKKLIEIEDFEGTGFTPQGPPGVEGQVPPAYKDLSNLVGKYKRNLENIENAINTKKTQEKDRPWKIKRLTIAVALDGRWVKDTDTKTGELVMNPDGSIKRTYIPVTDQELAIARDLVQAAVGYEPARFDLVTVRTQPKDRTAEFEAENEVFRQQKQVERIVFWIIIGVGLIFVAIIAFRLLSKYLERRRRLKEEELARQHQAMREAALRSAEEKGVEVELSVEERARLEMQENAINMAREHPEDVAQLIRTWLLEE
ncbi:MAG: flagellar M-ring protein FliF [Spirochaetales bacterium]|nr:flagellar M-ring protein FliF [Spirochaetales bacterium]